ncbi:hypothetical protein [Microbacterium sp.]|uniref:hypothetical protein n=1 Tax=Microbacterium sp. TaxID=51671 RepID=UPI0033405A6E
MTEKGAFAAMLVSRARRNPRAAFALVCGTVVVLLVAALGVGWRLGSADDGRIATLSKTAAAWPDGDVFPGQDGPVTRYEDYLGIMVGTFFRDESERRHCVVAGPRESIQGRCAAEPFSATVDILVTTSSPAELRTLFPVGATVRISFDGETVTVLRDRT